MGKRKIVISEMDNIAAIMDDDRATEFIIHRGDILLGDVFLASVENILPSIDAAFVNVGGEKMGFLHSSDVPGKGDLKNRLQPKQQLVVQVMKEPTGHKGPRVTTDISLPGRFLVMMPESKGISISRKIMDPKERARLKSVVSLVKPAGVGVIIRTEANLQKESDITEDFETLLERWQNIVQMADTAQPPTLLYRDQDLLYRVIREAVNEDVQEIVVDSAFGLQRAQQLLQTWNLDKNIKVSQYQGSHPILAGTGVEREIKLALQTKVPLPSGGYLYIQPTEALCVVDVNSGKFTSLDSQAETIKQTNLEACKEIARQLRLRNIGGMIIVDFIDMEHRAHQLQILETFEMELAPDKSKPQIGQLSDLGLVEMTRHRQGQALSEIFTKKCIACNGTGHAVEEFSWAPGHERSKRDQGGRHSKLPLKQGRHQNVPRPAASPHNRRESRIQLPQGAAPAAVNPVDVMPNSQQPARPEVAAGTLFLNRNKAEQSAPVQEAALQQQGGNGGKPQQRTDKVPEKPILELIEDKIMKEFGVKLSSVAKMSFIPPGPNSILARINPRANDVMTLVHTIENSPHMPTLISDEDEEDMDRDEEMGEEAPAPRRMPQRAAEVEAVEVEQDEEAPVTMPSAEEAPEQLPLMEEVAEEEEVVEEAPAEEKPRRGRPPKREVVAEVEAEEASDEEAPEEADEDEDEDAEETATEKKPLKRRGRPPKRPRPRREPVAKASKEEPAPVPE